MQITQSAEGKVVHVAGELSLYTAHDLRDALATALARESALSVDLSGIETCDTAAIQVLCSAVMTAASAGKEIGITGAPAAVVDVSQSLGVFV
jgi:anti-anti-sigma factor